jgi:TetR/AcrR family transcriptional regulator, transcriptional repressor for nem operon
MAARRRVGSETSGTRQALLDSVERLMLDRGYAAVTYRAVAALSDVTPGLVQYYFPTLDDLFLAAIRRRSQQNVERLREALAACPEHPLQVLWEYSNNETTAALTTEFMALGNHRTSIRSEIAEVAATLRAIQFEALACGPADDAVALRLPPEALAYLVTTIPRILRLEEGLGIDGGHAEIVAAVEEHLAST